MELETQTTLKVNFTVLYESSFQLNEHHTSVEINIDENDIRNQICQLI